MALGILLCFVLVFAGAMVGSMLTFLIARYLIQDTVQAWAHRYRVLRAVDRSLVENGIKVRWPASSLLKLSSACRCHGTLLPRHSSQPTVLPACVPPQMVVLLRLSPFVPTVIFNYVAVSLPPLITLPQKCRPSLTLHPPPLTTTQGVTLVSFHDFVLGSLGMMPWIATSCYIGSAIGGITGISQEPRSAHTSRARIAMYTAYTMGGAATLLIVYLLGLYTRRAFQEALAHDEAELRQSSLGRGLREEEEERRGGGSGKEGEEEEEGQRTGSAPSS